MVNGDGVGKGRETAAGGLLWSWGRNRDWTWRRRERGEDLQLRYMIPWMKWPVGSQGTVNRLEGEAKQ